MPVKNRYIRILSLALIAQAALFYGASRGDVVPDARPLSGFTRQLGPWFMTKEGHVDDETQAVLQADDTLTRVYSSPSHAQAASLFVAFFKTQRTGKAPHSPKNCLPGAGWEQSREGYLSVSIPGMAEPIQVHEYVVAKGESQSLVLYWYQTQKRVIASEYRAKFWTMADAIRYNRTDTALVRVVVPIGGQGEAAAEQTAVDFVHAFFNPLRQYLPS
jgi:EpsI family protein